MKVAKDGNRYSVHRITGPTKNWLRLEFTTIGDAPLEIIDHRPPPSPPRMVWRYGQRVEDPRHRAHENRPRPSAQIVEAEVKQGLDAANARLGCALRVQCIEFNSDDSPIRGVYARLTETVVEAVVKGGAEAAS